MPVPRMHAFVDVPAEQAEAEQEFWSAATGWPPGEPWSGHPEFVSLLPPDRWPYLHMQSIGGPPRVHLDLEGDLDRDTSRMEQLGAYRQQRGDGWQVLTSPAGLPFCVCGEAQTEARPDAATWPDGHRSLLVQLCIDVPARSYDSEVAFWQAATDWREEPVRAPEFRRLVHRVQSPLQLLVQRLGSDDDSGVRAHLDLGTDDIAAEVSRVEALGARRLWTGVWDFVALEDPAGLPFCVTGNSPDR